MASGTISKDILVETVGLQFTGGFATINFKAGYTLVNAYTVGRGTGEANTYAIANIYGRTNDTYQVQNKDTSLSAGLTARLIWVKG